MNPWQRCWQNGHGTTLWVMTEDNPLIEPQLPTRRQSPTWNVTRNENGRKEIEKFIMRSKFTTRPDTGCQITPRGPPWVPIWCKHKWRRWPKKEWGTRIAKDWTQNITGDSRRLKGDLLRDSMTAISLTLSAKSSALHPRSQLLSTLIWLLVPSMPPSIALALHFSLHSHTFYLPSPLLLLLLLLDRPSEIQEFSLW